MRQPDVQAQSFRSGSFSQRHTASSWATIGTSSKPKNSSFKRKSTHGKCLFRVRPEEIKIYLASADYMQPRIGRSVAEIHVPSSTRLSKTDFVSDITLLELDQALDFDDNVQPICLAVEFRERPGEFAVFAGWGMFRGLLGGRCASLLVNACANCLFQMEIKFS